MVITEIYTSLCKNVLGIYEIVYQYSFFLFNFKSVNNFKFSFSVDLIFSKKLSKG